MNHLDVLVSRIVSLTTPQVLDAIKLINYMSHALSIFLSFTMQHIRSSLQKKKKIISISVQVQLSLDECVNLLCVNLGCQCW